MGIPIIQEIFDGMRWLVDLFINRLPRPLQILFFLFMLIILGSLISVFLHLTGVHCNSDREPMKTSPLSFTSNFKFMSLDENDVYNPEAIEPDRASLFEDCFYAVCNYSNDYYYESATECENESIEYLMRFATDSFGCVSCNQTDIYVKSGVDDYDHLTHICSDDAYRLPYDDMNWFQRTTCDSFSNCYPPPNYYFDSTTGLYTCSDLDVCGINVTNETKIYEVDELLLEVDAELLYNNVDKKDYKRLIDIRCDEGLKPNLTFYGINVFSYKIWLFFIVIYILVVVLLQIKKR